MPRLLVLRQHGDSADVGVERAVGRRVGIANQPVAVMSRSAVHRATNHLRQPGRIASSVLPPDRVEQPGGASFVCEY
jgi:hypothetical protein